MTNWGTEFTNLDTILKVAMELHCDGGVGPSVFVAELITHIKA